MKRFEISKEIFFTKTIRNYLVFDHERKNLENVEEGQNLDHDVHDDHGDHGEHELLVGLGLDDC